MGCRRLHLHQRRQRQGLHRTGRHGGVRGAEALARLGNCGKNTPGAALAASRKGVSMKIANITVRQVDVPHLHPYVSAWGPPDRVEYSRGAVIVKVETDEGLTGWGIGDPQSGITNRDVVAPQLIGQDVYALARQAEVMRRAGTFLVDMALCDIIGKAAGQPLHRLWGNRDTRVQAYASTIVAATPEQRAEDALAYLEQGFTAIKLRTAFPTLAEDIALVSAVRDAVGDRMVIMVDANLAGGSSSDHRPAWDFDRALAEARELEQLDVYWLEEPLPRDDFATIARLTAETDIAIAGGEGNIGMADFVEMIRVGAYDILQPDTATSCEALSQFIKIAAAAEFAGKLFVPHHGVTGLGIAAHMQLSVCIPNCPYVEFILDEPYRTVEHYQQLGGIVDEPLRIDAEGNLPVPTRPGLGVGVNEDAIAQYEVEVTD
ncbi:MAG: mandelate racemase/muconate lactonizing enzyme family protein [Chloroflexi bacterium]|nr:mandelate racemase/muconate lactonizing enzyme family protein [Chloroflexota bacterium]